jgi:hypothetical protein
MSLVARQSIAAGETAATVRRNKPSGEQLASLHENLGKAGDGNKRRRF